MSKIVEAKELRQRDLFEMPNGSVYLIAGRGDAAGGQHARLWCAHPPDPITFAPPRIDFPPGQEVQLLSGHEMRVHYGHAGYVETVFAQEMDRRYAANMQVVHERGQREAAEQRQRARADRPWWRKLFG